MSGQLLVDIDKNIIVSEYELILCKPNKEEICTVNANNIVYTAEFANIDELEFEVPSYIMDEHKKVKNPIFDLVKGDYLIKFDNYKFFIITNVIKESTEDGNEYKKISCLSKEYEFAKKQIVEYRANSRKLYDISNSKDEDGLDWGIMNYIERLTSWKVDYIKTNLMERRRSFDIARQNLIQTFKDIQLSYGCLFKFDTENKLINIYEVTDLGVDRGLYISDDNYIKSITENIKHDEIKTRLYLYGKDNISINKLNPTGSFYLENFEFYKTTEYMEQSLIDALDNYQVLVQSKQGDFESYLTHLNTLNEQLITKETELFGLETELEVINDNIDTKIKNEEDYEDLNVQKETKQLEIDVKNTEITGLNSKITVVNNNISNLRNIIKSENNFTSEQLGELDYFIKEETYQDSNYTEENIDELYERGQEMLAKISQPPIEFDIDVVDFLSIVECQHDWDKLILGDIVTIQHESLGIDIQVRLIGYVHDVDSNSLTLKFSNRNSIDDPNVYLKDLLSQMSSTSTQVDFSRFKWGQYDEDKKSDILLYVDSELDAARNKILAGKNQNVVIGDRGIILGDKNNPNEEVRLLNNIIAFTNDGWKTANLALTPKGLVAEHVVGKLGIFATVQANQIEVSDSSQNPNVEYSILDYVDTQASELNNSMDAFEVEINNAFSDNKITNIEANSLKLSYQNMLKEAEDVINIANSLEVSVDDITTKKDNLTTEINKWIDKESYPLDVTVGQRSAMLGAFTSLEGAISELYKSIDEKRINDTNTNLTNYVDGINEDLTSLIDGKIDTWFYNVEPTLLNAPANSWTDNATKDKHLDDLYYDTTTGYTYRFTKSETVYNWTRITDKDVVNAMKKANNAQDTADGKRTIFTSTPTPPYSAGDLWRVSNVDGVDFKICITERLTGNYLASHWADVSNVKDYIDQQTGELDGALNILKSNINDFSSDLKLTLAEANTLKLSLDSLTSESIDLVNVATSLGVTTEKNNYSNALTTLTNYLNTNWLNKNYPFTITITQRNNVNNYFKNVENRKSILINKISEVRDQNSVQEGSSYNGVKIGTANGIETYQYTNGTGKKRGQWDYSGLRLFGADGITKVLEFIGATGSLSMMGSITTPNNTFSISDAGFKFKGDNIPIMRYGTYVGNGTVNRNIYTTNIKPIFMFTWIIEDDVPTTRPDKNDVGPEVKHMFLSMMGGAGIRFGENGTTEYSPYFIREDGTSTGNPIYGSVAPAIRDGNYFTVSHRSFWDVSENSWDYGTYSNLSGKTYQYLVVGIPN